LVPATFEASKETVRQWMIGGKLWLAKKEKVQQVHTWRPRRSRLGELVQWDTSEHDWLEGRGEKLYLIAMIDDATSRLFARFVRHDLTEENMKLLWDYLKKFGSGRLFLDRVARQQSPSPLHRRPQNNTHSAELPGKGDISTLLGRGHFYFALTADIGTVDTSRKIV
jgi:hypothetical protein